MKNTVVAFTDDLKFEEFAELLKRMYTRMEHENSWPWVTDSEKWNREFPDHKVEPSKIN
jgi:hypothetical protein